MKTSQPAHTFSKIKDLWLEVANCDFYHSHLEGKEGFFLGRRKAKEHLKMLLRHSKSQSGAYLITGYRGMGKTSLVHSVLKELNEKKNKKKRPFEKISISLSQDDIRDMDVLRLIARQLASKWSELYVQKSWWRLFPPWGFALAATIFLLAWFLRVFLPNLYNDDWTRDTFLKISEFEPVYLALIFGVGILSVVVLNALHHWLYGLILGHKNYPRIRERIDLLNARLDAMVTQEKGLSIAPEAKSSWGFKMSLFSATTKSSQSFKIATPKEIEKELIGIFNDIDKYRNWPLDWSNMTLGQRCGKRLGCFFRIIHRVPEFVFILDELDKIEPDFVTSPTYSENSQNSVTLAHNTQRRETIVRLLSSLKSFLNEAKAKFIFIGGREMYDASLADTADRETFYGSIFHSVIYLNSFFKDKIQHRAGVSRITEAYLCHMLIPDWYVREFIKNHPNAKKKQNTDEAEWYSLETMYHYLVDSQRNVINAATPYKYQYWQAIYDVREEREAAYKIVYLLQNFIIFLTYRSSGTPKKLAGLLENYIVTGDASRIPGEGNTGSYLYDEEHENEIVLFSPPSPKVKMPVTHHCAGKIFLKFNFNQQYEIGLTSNLYRPYVIIHSRHMKALGDKLLFSSTYIMDYILKFHPHGFSWRNLEMVPDIILTNKDPNLRDFMQDLVQFLSRMYIRETVNGMFQYRFFSKVVNEIRFLSKISEQGAAAFNFTLDESQQIKHYYRDKLHHQQKRHEGPVQISLKHSPFVHSISFLQNLLGDLHYYDKEYDDAIIHYSDAAQPLRERSAGGKLTNHQIVLLVRTQLKLGMALERIRAFDSAYSIYRSLMMEIPGWLKQKNDPNSGDMPLSRMQLLVRPYIAILDLVEKQRIDGITFSNLRKNLADLNVLLDEHRPYPILKQSEAPSLDGKDNIRLNTLYSDYFSNVGSILYFKNFNFPDVYKYFKQGQEPDNKGFKELKEASLAAFLEKYRKTRDGKYVFDYNPSLSAYIYYRQAITEQIASFRKDIIAALDVAKELAGFKGHLDGDLKTAVLLLHPATCYITNSLQMYIMGNLFSKLGDAVLSSAGADVLPLSDATLEIYQYDDSASNINNLLHKCLDSLGKDDFLSHDALNATLLMYRISGLFYLKAGRSYSCAFQFKKFLFVVKDWLAFMGRGWIDCSGVKKEETEEERKIRRAYLAKLDNLLISDGNTTPSIASRLFRSIVWSSDVANRPQLLKYREIFNLPRTQDTTSIYNNISTSPETREVVLLIEEIRLKLACLGALDTPLHLNLVTPYDSISSKYLRVMELKYKCEYNFVRLKDMGAEILLEVSYYKGERSSEEQQVKKEKTIPAKSEEDWARSLEELQKLQEKFKIEGNDVAVENCVLDSIFCLYEIIRSLNIYGTNYVTNHSFIANAHYKLANWCRAFQNLRHGHVKAFEKTPDAQQDPWKIRHEGQLFDDRLIKLLGTDALFTMEVNYHNEQAIEHYYAAIQTHKGGRSYRDNVTNMSFLEDDLNDNLTHFSAATERFRINTGVIRKKIGELKSKIAGSQVYDFESYVGKSPGGSHLQMDA
ncbi:MAG: hypothetical protein ACKVU0_16025 [Saprospiraceae bacterium]